MNLDWDKLKLFKSVAEAGSLTEAARRLNMSQPALSRQMTALEQALGAGLFHRHARGLALTHEGEQLLVTARGMAEDLERLGRAIDVSRDLPTGEIRLTTTVSFGSTWLVQALRGFFDAYPDIQLNMVLSDDELDLASRQADVAIRFHPPQQADLIQRRMARCTQHICASPEYLERHGTPQSAADLGRHRLIAYGDLTPAPIKDVNWLLHAGLDHGERQPTLLVNTILGLLQAVEAGLGIAVLPSYLLRFSRTAVPILQHMTGPTFQIYMAYPSALRTSKRIAALRDYLVPRLTTQALALPDSAGAAIKIR